jgi:uncharacterized protein YcfL
MRYILTIVIILFILSSCRNEEKNPRTMNGKTYLRIKDSVYLVTFQIDSVILMEYEAEDR